MIKRSIYIPFGDTTDTSVDYLLGIFEDAHVTTLQRVHNVPVEELHWQFAEGWNTISALLSHMIADKNYFRIHYIEGRKFTPEEELRWTPGMEMGIYIPQLITGKPVESYIQELEESQAQLLTGIKALTREDLTKARTGDTPDEIYNLAWVLYHVAEDEVHHRGQISILRKLYKMQNETR